ncbi:MAG: methylenetetrahydrofolate--tRNA-(uracil(54)-C(5))-methyltransferase (FADH(2)-oxidizing) TrmFO [bacterium]|nr:methylenetetrahydrofolate--tRNA-(uracil(54)-C(5))-methyltransferase (FADH(2)-oxidizing) TrmFO [bacterium]
MPTPAVTVVGGGLAGCEAALQLARLGVPVVLREMRPVSATPVHRGDALAQIVCSNSLKSTEPTTAGGVLKQELDALGCALLPAARACAVPAGSALAVDREAFSREVASRLDAGGVPVERGPVEALPPLPGHLWLVATGPLTSAALVEELGRATGQPALHFFDAIAPTVTLASLDLTILYRAARYGRGEADYLNAALDRGQYETLHRELLAAEKADVHAFDRGELFAGCQPIEEIAASGPQSLAFGPLRPVGLRNPRPGAPRPHAVVQLRQENREGTLYGLVGFQTRLRQGEQRRVLRLIPGLENAEFVRYGQLHRNFYLDTPRCCALDFSLLGRPDVLVAGQMTGVEGYVESIASGLFTAWQAASRLRGLPLPALPAATILGSLLGGFLFDRTTARLTPMNANFGLLPDLPELVRDKRERKLARAACSRRELATWLATPIVRDLLDA